ncbi:uncharacterized protein LOC129737899 [Uranotaenia lowii]|uniref:uncharacterized protein LOC129737899 n=1 Tax=Uranotaenia lowii TaxID=190385 RepID=UPI00247A361F|nr:uncharacterized protein LOC129737899 [Uranotaenia lowii]
MAKTKWILLFATFVSSCLSLATLIVAFCTPNWVVSEATEPLAQANSEVQYGLFSGSLTRYFLVTPVYYDLTVICLYEHNVCVYSCQTDEAKREKEVHDLMTGSKPDICPIATSRIIKLHSTAKDSIQGFDASTEGEDKSVESTDEFINAGLWLATVIFLGIATAFSGTSASFSIINVLFNPVEPIFSVFGLYIWNGIAIGATLLTMILWGALFEDSITTNISITDTLTSEAPYSSEGLASLGYSYWILFMPLVFHGGNIGLLLWRQYEINKEPPETTIDVDKSDLTVIMY